MLSSFSPEAQNRTMCKGAGERGVKSNSMAKFPAVLIFRFQILKCPPVNAASSFPRRKYLAMSFPYLAFIAV